MATKVAIGTILLGISCEYVNNNRKESIATTTPAKEQASSSSTSTNDPPIVETTTILTVPLEKTHIRSLSLVHLNELALQIRPSQPTTLPPVDGGDELNESSFRDADDNYQCLTNDQNCPPVSTFSKALTPGLTNNDPSNTNSSSNPLATINNKDEGIVFTTQTSTTSTTAAAKKQDLNDVERYKMCGNSIII